MTARTVEEFIIPRCQGRAFTIEKGQTLRIIQTEAPQAADMIAFNRDDHRESMSAWLTRHMGGSFTDAARIYSRLPYGNVMFTTLDAAPGILWLTGGRCNRLTYRDRYGIAGYHANCQDILAGCIEPFGMSEYDVPEVLNIFQKALLDDSGNYRLEEYPLKEGDHVDLRAEMACLVAVSACPDDVGPYNGHRPKPLKIKVMEAQDEGIS